MNNYYENEKIEKRFPLIKEQKHLIPNIESNDIDKLLTFKDAEIYKFRLIQNVLELKHKVFINISRYDYEKGHDKLIKSFELVNESHPNTSLVIVASRGKLKDETINLVSNSIASKTFLFLAG